MATRHVVIPTILPEPPIINQEKASEEDKVLLDWLKYQLLPSLQQAFDQHVHTHPAAISGENRAKQYTEANKPAAADAGTGAIILSTDAATKPQMSDGAAWIGLGGGAGAPSTAEYLVAVADGGLSAERVATDTPTVDVDMATAAQAKWHAIGLRVTGPLDLAAGAVADGEFLKRSGASIIGGSAGSSIYQDFEKDLGTASCSGTFDITGLSGLTADKNVLIFQTAQAIASKGNARDEAEMDQIQLTGYVFDATTIRAYWWAPSVVVGTYEFAYKVSD